MPGGIKGWRDRLAARLSSARGDRGADPLVETVAPCGRESPIGDTLAPARLKVGRCASLDRLSPTRPIFSPLAAGLVVINPARLITLSDSPQRGRRVGWYVGPAVTHPHAAVRADRSRPIVGGHEWTEC